MKYTESEKRQIRRNKAKIRELQTEFKAYKITKLIAEPNGISGYGRTETYEYWRGWYGCSRYRNYGE